jgi:hypothetical protein
MPLYELVFTSVATAVVRADSPEEAHQMGCVYDTSELDWISNVDFDYAEEVDGAEEDYE